MFGFIRPSGNQGDRRSFRVALATLCVVLVSTAARGQIRPEPAALADASADLLDHLRADFFAYFRFVNRPWTARVCGIFADVRDAPIVRLHGDAHVQQFAFTRDPWGLGDFDDSARDSDSFTHSVKDELNANAACDSLRSTSI